MEAISHAGTCLGILSAEGVVLAAEKRVVAKLLDTVAQAEKIYKLDEFVCVCVCVMAMADWLWVAATLRARWRVSPLMPTYSWAGSGMPRSGV